MPVTKKETWCHPINTEGSSGILEVKTSYNNLVCKFACQSLYQTLNRDDIQKTGHDEFFNEESNVSTLTFKVHQKASHKTFRAKIKETSLENRHRSQCLMG